jgi:hypothetical protein
MDPCQEFQGPDAKEVPGCAPCAGIDFPRPGFPPVGKVVDEKAFLPNVPNK